jgi:hypothetical protein
MSWPFDIPVPSHRSARVVVDMRGGKCVDLEDDEIMRRDRYTYPFMYLSEFPAIIS